MSMDAPTFPAPAEALALADPDPRPDGERIAPWQVRAAIAHMQANLARPITLGELAAVAGISVFHFSRGFRNAIGEPPLRHLTRLRIREACHLLASTAQPVGTIALAVGYRSPQAFARAFERLCGCTPSAHRHRCASGADLSHCCNDRVAGKEG